MPSESDPSAHRNRPPLVQCFIPAFNEALIIASTVRRVDEELSVLDINHEVVVVDDASTDGTTDIVRGLGLSRVRVVDNANGPSFRENLGRAMRVAEGDIVVYIDADLSPDPCALRDVIDAVRAGDDIAIGCRYMSGSVTVRTPVRLFVSRAYNGFLRMVFASPFVDHQCGLKAFRRERLHSLMEQMRCDERQVGRAWFWDAELLIRAVWAGYRVREVPIRWTYRKRGHFMPLRQVRMLPYLARLLRDRPG